MLPYREEEKDIKDNTDISCPYCKSSDVDVLDYNVGQPPMQDWLYISWKCGECCRDFDTEHALDEKGNIKRE